MQVFSQEPYTNGKVCINTTKGEIEIELWGKETPKASRNFIQLCMEGYYNNTIFHRLVSGFIIQGGDPTGTGMGGQSIWDEPFSDEFHSRLRYNRRGLVGMANTSKNDNGSQFFITLAPTPELQGKNTLFGRVVGNSIYNVLRMAELETDKNERPLYPPKIVSTEVLLNPFDDIIPRTTEEDRRKRTELFVSSEENFKNKAKKNKVLLSFQDEETNEEICKLSKFKSSHDIGDDVKLSEQPAIITSVKRKQDFLDETKETQIVTKDVKDVENETKSPFHSTLSVEKLGKKDSSDSKKTKMEEIQEQIHVLKDDIKAISKKKSKYSDSKESEKEKLLSYLEKEKERYRVSEKAIVGSRGKSKKVREEETLAKLSLFQSKISSKNCIEIEEEEEEEEKDACELHGVPGCFSCFDRLGEHNDLPDENNSDWFAKRLVFAKDKLGKDHTFSASRVDDFEIIDPRERKERAIFEEKMKKKKYEISKSFKPNYKGHS